MIRMLFAWCLMKLAESDARHQRRFACQLEADWRAAVRGIDVADRIASARGAAYRNMRLGRRFPLPSEKALLARALERRMR